MKSIQKKQLRLLLSEDYVLVLFVSSSEIKVLYEGRLENFSSEEIIKQFYDYSVYVFVDSLDINFLKINVEKLMFWHIFQLKKRILEESPDSVVSITRGKQNLHITKICISPPQQQLIEKLQSFFLHPINVSILACSLVSLHPQKTAIALQQKNGAQKIFLYENGIPNGIKVVSENKDLATSSLQALKKITFKKNHLTSVLPGYKDAKYLLWVKCGIWCCILLFLALVVMSIVPQIKKYNDSYKFESNRASLEEELNEIPQVDAKKYQFKATLPKLSKLEVLERKNINPISIFKKMALILNPLKISSAEIHIDEKEVLHLSFLIDNQGLSSKIVETLKQSFLPPIDVKIERKTATESVLQISGNSSLFKEKEK